ncbi:Crp/Fnr family transcriptional regulator [uncultured Croceitalea sp.]|uniref:Crp/Fnr family transcriptional regulator n=1 Tax=uncultured Croceitalea sp. TaxID=1798908 RepID=UPI003305CA6F
MERESVDALRKCLPLLPSELYHEILIKSELKELPKGHMLVRQGKYIDFLPIVVDGIIKMYTEEADSQFLLYYINPGETCILNFNHISSEEPVQFSGITEEPTKVLILPGHCVKEWMSKSTAFCRLIIENYQRIFEDLLLTTREVVFCKIEQRLIKYLSTKASLKGNSTVQISHKIIAQDLSTSREVITRLIKKLETNNIIKTGKGQITLNYSEYFSKN